MTNTALLEEQIAKSGFKKSFIAGELGLSSYGFSLKVNNKSDFKGEEIKKLCSLLHIEPLELKDEIFFA